MSKKLFISDDAPQELKENIEVVQRMMDNMAEFKVKADAGTLTFDDLDELTRRNNALALEIPPVKKPLAGYPTVTNDMDQLEALAKSRALEAETLLKESGGPVFKITSFDQLKSLSVLPPNVLADMVLDEARKQRGRAEDVEDAEEETAVSSDVKIKQEFESDLIKENLEVIHDLLFSAKIVLFNLQNDWAGVEPAEQQLHLNARAFRGNKQAGVDMLKNILTGDEKDEDLADKKPEAAFILVSIATESGKELETLLELWEEDEELAPVIVQAMKYSANPYLLEWIQLTFGKHSPDIQSGLIEVLEFHQLVESEKWDSILDYGEPKVSAKIVRAYANSGIQLDRGKRGFLLEDPDADYFEAALFSALLAGDNNETLFTCRKRLIDTPEKTVNLSLFLACAGVMEDFRLIRHCLPEEKIRAANVSALGILGLPQGVMSLIELFVTQITCKEDWDQQTHVLDSLNLITGADLPLLLPEIKEGPEGKEYEVTVEINWKNQWLTWWFDNQERFDPDLRYRRGKPFTLESCIDEMAYERGNYWSRQFSYYELQIRSGQHIAPFFADWNVKEQLEAIEKWRLWWQDHQYSFSKKQWLFAGR